MKERCQWTAALLPLLVFSACAPESQEHAVAAADDPILAADSPVALTPYAQEGNAALIRGRLVLEEGCLYLRIGNNRVLPTFPWPGTRWNPSTQTLNIFDRYSFRVGDQIEAGGGFLTPEGGGEGRAIEQALVMPRPQCDLNQVAVLYFGPGTASL